MKNVLATLHALEKNASAHVKVPVAYIRNALLSITKQYVIVARATLVIHMEVVASLVRIFPTEQTVFNSLFR